jgi:hypothetical protein
MSTLYGDVHIKAGFPVLAGESILAGAPLAVTEDGFAKNYDVSNRFIGYAVLSVNNSAGGDGDKSVAVAIDGLMIDEVSDLVIGSTALGSRLHLDANGLPVLAATNPAVIGHLIGFLGGKKAIYRISYYISSGAI